MVRFTRNACMLAAILATAALTPLVSSAQDRDTTEVTAYTMTEASLAKYTQAVMNLAAVPNASCGGQSDDMSIDDQVAQIDATPGAAGAISSAGMTTREYVVFTWSLLQTGLAVWAKEQSGNLPADANKANVTFYEKHRADWAKLESMNQDDACDDSDDGEDDGE
jgi:hypothetical protein